MSSLVLRIYDSPSGFRVVVCRSYMILLSDEFNTNAYDRTRWFAFVDEQKWLEKLTVPKGQMDNAKKANGHDLKGPTIPDESTDESTDKESLASLVDHFNKIALKHGLPKCAKLTDTRIKSLKHRIKDAGGEDEFKKVLDKIHKSSFLRGITTSWKCSFDFCLQASSFQKMSEDTYADKKGSRTGW